VRGPDGKVDKLVGIEGLRGTFLDDVMAGDELANFFEGGRGADSIDGRQGLDLITYDNDADRGGVLGIVTHFKKGFVVDGFGHRDRVTGIEQIEGTDFNDRFRDNRSDNLIEGNDDDDRIVMSRGADVAEGGDGADVFVFAGVDFGTDIIDDFSTKEGDTIRLLDVDRRSDLKSVAVVEGDLVIELNALNRIILEGFDGNMDGALFFG
jgi:Ca2+-binding RTX toxin-like protein